LDGTQSKTGEPPQFFPAARRFLQPRWFYRRKPELAAAVILFAYRSRPAEHGVHS
jgi:hypothetical protein